MRYHERVRWILNLEVTPTKRLVLIALADHANQHGECFPSIPRLAKLTGFTVRCVRKALRDLESASLLVCTQAAGKVSTYILQTPDPGTPFRPPRHQEPGVPRHAVPPTPAPGTATPAPGSHERSKERSKERSTLTHPGRANFEFQDDELEILIDIVQTKGCADIDHQIDRYCDLISADPRLMALDRARQLDRIRELGVWGNDPVTTIGKLLRKEVDSQDQHDRGHNHDPRLGQHGSELRFITAEPDVTPAEWGEVDSFGRQTVTAK